MQDAKKLYHTKAGGGGIERRNSNLELYRILCMLLMVAHHYVVNSGLTATDGPIFSDPLSARSLFLLLFGAWGKTGIDCFTLITGYYMCRAKITPKKFAKLLFEIMFYHVVIALIFWITGYEPFSLKLLVLTLLPITQITQNYVSCFLIFYLSIPFLNALVNNLNERQHLRLILLCAFVYIFLGSISNHLVGMNYVSWFIVLYFIASYLRLYPKPLLDKTKLWGWVTLITVGLSGFSVWFATWLGVKIGRGAMSYFFVSDANKLLAVLTAVSSFLFFHGLKLSCNKTINTVAATTFGVLLIHTCNEPMRRWLWGDVLNCVDVYELPNMPCMVICSVVGVFVVCSLIDYLRIQLLEKPFLVWWDRRWPAMEACIQNKEAALCERLHIEL